MMINAVGTAVQASLAPVKSVVADAAPAPVKAPATPEPDEAQLTQAVRDANHAARMVSSNIEFSVDQKSGKTIVKVVDSTTQQLIRQMPTEEMIEIARALDRMQGMLLKRQA